MPNKLKVGDRVIYKHPGEGRVCTLGMIGNIGTVKVAHPSGRVHVEFDKPVGHNATNCKPGHGWINEDYYYNLIPQNEEELLTSLLNRRITPEEYESLKGGT